MAAASTLSSSGFRASSEGPKPEAGRSLEITVVGRPVPQGSKRAFVNRTSGRAVVVDVNDRELKSWRQAITEAAVRAAEAARWETADCALSLTLTFYLPRPAGHFAKDGQLRASAPKYPTTRPDADKLARAVDALTDAGIWRDDSRVVDLHVRKRYAVQRPGLFAEVEVL